MNKIAIAAAAAFVALPAQPAMAQLVPGSTYALTPEPDRISVFVLKNERGTSRPIDQRAMIRFCGDEDGCTVRIGMHNWDDRGRVASREFLFFYNPRTLVWRASLGDASGTDSNNSTQHVNRSWACHMTDGVYRNWVRQGDTAPGLALLSWNQYNADCWLTIID
jgi:hypothetical protein